MLPSILVTGGAGYVGSHACKALAVAGYRPVVYDSLSRGHRGAVKWGPLVEGDLHDRDRLVAAMRSHHVAAVMHFAAFAYVGESVLCPGALLPQQRCRHALAARCDARGRRRDDRLLVDLRGVRDSRGRPDSRDDRQGSRSTLTATPSSRSSAHCAGTATPMACVTSPCAISMRRAPIRTADIGEDHDPETHLIPLVYARRARPRRSAANLRHRLSDAGRHGDPRLHPCDRSGRRACSGVGAVSQAGARAWSLILEPGAAIRCARSSRRWSALAGRKVPRREAPRRPGDPPELVADSTLARERLGWHPQYSDLETIVRTALAWETRSAHAG